MMTKGIGVLLSGGGVVTDGVASGRVSLGWGVVKEVVLLLKWIGVVLVFEW